MDVSGLATSPMVFNDFSWQADYMLLIDTCMIPKKMMLGMRRH